MSDLTDLPGQPTRAEVIADRANANHDEFVARGPGLRRSTRIWIVAKDPVRQRVLLGGLGAMGVGQMWCDVSPGRDYALLIEDETYADAPIRDSRGGAGVSDEPSTHPFTLSSEYPDAAFVCVVCARFDVDYPANDPIHIGAKS